jgi:hypothetical protein
MDLLVGCHLGALALQPLAQYAMLKLGHPGPGACVPDLRSGLRGDGVRFGVDAAPVVAQRAQRPPLDAAATTD